MRHIVFFAAFIFVFSAVSLPSARGFEGAGDELVMVIGQQQVLDATGIDSFSESTRGIVEIKIPKNGRQLVITAIRSGNTSLLLLDNQGNQRQLNISVFARDPRILISELKELIGTTPGVQFRQSGARVLVDGTVQNQNELNRINQILSLYPGQTLSLVQVGPTVRPRTNIRLDLTFVEFHTSDDIAGGINWPSDFGAGDSNLTLNLVSGMPEASYRVVNQIMPSLHAAQARGHAKIRKQAHLMTTNGNSATYSSGGEINIPIAGSQAAELRRIQYGCNLKVLPHIDTESKLIDLQVEAEVSELRDTNQGAPGRTLSRVNTLVHLGLGQSIVLSGLDSHTESKSKKGIPFLSRIPIFGMLFGIHQKRDEKVTGIIAITPVVIDNVDRESQRQINEALEKFRKFKG